MTTEQKSPDLTSLEKKLGPELTKMMNLIPLPADVRGHILAKTHCWIPEEVTDLWGYLLSWTPPAGAIKNAIPVVERARYRVEASRTRTAYGTAQFSATETETASERLTAEEIASIIEGAATREEAEDLLIRHVEDWNYESDDVSDYSYSDEDVTHHGDIDDSENNVSSVLDSFFSDNPEYDPEREEDEED